ncbi:Cation/H(+) antiporter 3 [Citrus sinensis]|uniref:Cation/H(+) antiporter 3 n=1 Tax=Citrus sinensis TaxID=2711 RepID=A0ACB8J9D7_CITSI|nr:Cation/H(+) antiporter 3 [Citrus sinensis]
MNSLSGKNVTRVCLKLPPKVQSQGLWKRFSSFNYNWLEFSLPRFELTIALIFIITQSLHSILKRFGFPLFTSQLLVRNVLVVGTIGSFGFAFFLFLMGVKMDPTMITRVSKKALYLGLLAVAAPLVAALLIPPVFNLKQLDRWKTLYISPCYTSSSFPTISCLLNDLRISNSELGRTGLSSAIVSDLLGIVLIVAFSSDREAVQVGIRVFVKRLFYVSVFLVFIFLVIRPTMKLVVQCTPGGRPVHPIVVTILTMLFLFSVFITKWFPQFMVSAPYALGLAVPHGPPLGSALVEKFEGMVDQLLLPLFVTAWMRVSTFNFFGTKNTLTNGSALIAALVGLVKFVVCALPPLYNEMPTKDAIALACIMKPELYSNVFFLIIYTATIVPVLVKALHDPSRKYAGYYRRNIMDAKLNSELQIVAFINFLDISCPTKDHPMVVNVPHMVKLRGQVTPIFIAHQKKRNPFVTCSYSENVIISFNKYEANKWGAVTVNTFTAVSPPSLMQDERCTLALDELASLIILPFDHDESVRVLNSTVLEKAPCSLGILIDPGNMMDQIQDTSTQRTYSVAMIFQGGESEGWDKVLDSVMSRDIKTNGYMNYIEKEVNDDGPETTVIIRSMVNEFDLILVGRRYNLESQQTSGLKEWSEFPELGILGDLLASVEFSGRCSTLVVQQQQIRKATSLK